MASLTVGSESPLLSLPNHEDGMFVSWGCGEFGQHCHKVNGDVSFEDGIIDQFSQSRSSRIKLMACGASHTIVVTSK